MPQKTYEVHAIAALLPEMQPEEWIEFRADIAANGLIVPIRLFEGKILDGRHGYKACLETGKEPHFKPFEGTWAEAADYVSSMNLKRRNLTEGQKAIAAAELATLGRGRPSKNTAAAGFISQTQAAKTFGVSPDSVGRAAKVLRDGVPELAELVKKGELSVTAGAVIASETKPQQRRIMKQGAKDRLANAAVTLRAASTLRRAKSTMDCCLKCNKDLLVTEETFLADAMAFRAALISKGGRGFARYVDGMIEEYQETGVLDETQNLELGVMNYLIASHPAGQSDQDLRARLGVAVDDLKFITKKLAEGGWIYKDVMGGKQEKARGGRTMLWFLTEKGRDEDYYHDVLDQINPSALMAA